MIVIIYFTFIEDYISIGNLLVYPSLMRGSAPNYINA